MSASEDCQKIAGDIVFGGSTLDNAARGIFLEAVMLHVLGGYDKAEGHSPRWRHAGAGWGPWDLQRGIGASGDRVRVQMKVKAKRQVWQPYGTQVFEFDLGWKTAATLPSYIPRDFPKEVFGDCEATGHRCDLFLLAWHGPNPLTAEMANGDAQSDPANYNYFIVPSSAVSGMKKISAKHLFQSFAPINFRELARSLNQEAGAFLAGRMDAAL